nr:amidase [Oharaeibacter diazotrophicus]
MVALATAFDAGQLSCREAMEAVLDRIERVDGHVNAIVGRADPDLCRAAADRADAERRAGRARGALHGVPIAIKDLSAAAGLPFTCGSPLHAGDVAAVDDPEVARIRAAGAIVIGKTNTPEFGLGSHTFNPVYGVTRNPHDLSRSAGGSSGGAAAALAARLLPVADGSDMMGSLRNPGAFCNVVGFRPSFGLVPSGGTAGDVFLDTLATVGPMGRSVADVAALLRVQAGRDRLAPFSYEASDLDAAPPADLAGVRVGWLADVAADLPFEDGILALCRDALDVFTRAGAVVRDVRSNFPRERLWDCWTTLRSAAVAGGHAATAADPARRALMKPELLWEVERGARFSALDVHAASVARSDWYRALLALYDDVDVLVLPSAQVFPFDADLHFPAAIDGVAMDTYHRWMEVVIGPSLAGLPVAAMPAGFGRAGLPAGIQIVGRPRADGTVLRIAAAYEARTPWLAVRPAGIPD